MGSFSHWKFFIPNDTTLCQVDKYLSSTWWGEILITFLRGRLVLHLSILWKLALRKEASRSVPAQFLQVSCPKCVVSSAIKFSLLFLEGTHGQQCPCWFCCQLDSIWITWEEGCTWLRKCLYKIGLLASFVINNWCRRTQATTEQVVAISLRIFKLYLFPSYCK